MQHGGQMGRGDDDDDDEMELSEPALHDPSWDEQIIRELDALAYYPRPADAEEQASYLAGGITTGEGKRARARAVRELTAFVLLRAQRPGVVPRRH